MNVLEAIGSRVIHELAYVGGLTHSVLVGPARLAARAAVRGQARALASGDAPDGGYRSGCATDGRDHVRVCGIHPGDANRIRTAEVRSAAVRHGHRGDRVHARTGPAVDGASS